MSDEISVIVPGYNERESLPELCRAIEEALNSAAEEYEVMGLVAELLNRIYYESQDKVPHIIRQTLNCASPGSRIQRHPVNRDR